MSGGQIGNMFEVYVEPTCPATDGDQIVVNSIKYSVQNVKVMDFGIQYYNKLIVVKGSDA